jgi:hypothetical protein
MRNTILLAATAAILVACGERQMAADSTRADSNVAVGDAPAPAQPAPTPAALVVTPIGIGPVRAGMTLAELRDALDSVRFTDPDSMRCAYPKFRGLPEGVWVMVEQGVVGRIDVQKGDVTTAEGIRIGDSKAKVQSTYGARMRAVPHKYTDGQYLEISSPQDTVHLIVFETNVQGTVLRFRSGKVPQVRYVESCS